MAQNSNLSPQIISLDDFHLHQDNINVRYYDKEFAIISGWNALVEVWQNMRMNINVFVACFQGRIECRVKGEQVAATEGNMIIVPSGSLVDNVMISPDIKWEVICMTDQFLRAILGRFINVWNRAFYTQNSYVLAISEEDGPLLMSIYEAIKAIIETPHSTYYNEEVMGVSRSLLLRLFSIMQKGNPTPPEPVAMSSGTSAIFDRFLQLLQASPEKHLTVEHFATKLCVTPKYLSAVCKQHSGKTALAWITQYTMEEIRYYLEQTSLPLKEISARLGFPNPSFFGKYVKQHFGVSPVKMRQHL